MLATAKYNSLLLAVRCLAIVSFMFIMLFELDSLSLCFDTVMLSSVIPANYFKNLSDSEYMVELFESVSLVSMIKQYMTHYEFYDEHGNIWVAVECIKPNKYFKESSIVSYLTALEYLFADPNRFPIYTGITIFSSWTLPKMDALIHKPYTIGWMDRSTLALHILSQNISALRDTENTDVDTFYFSYTKPTKTATKIS